MEYLIQKGGINDILYTPSIFWPIWSLKTFSCFLQIIIFFNFVPDYLDPSLEIEPFVDTYCEGDTVTIKLSGAKDYCVYNGNSEIKN